MIAVLGIAGGGAAGEFRGRGLSRAPVYASPRDEHSAKDGGVSYSFSTHGLPLAD